MKSTIYLKMKSNHVKMFTYSNNKVQTYLDKVLCYFIELNNIPNMIMYIIIIIDAIESSIRQNPAKIH